MRQMLAQREELVERIARTISTDGTVIPLAGLHLSRHSQPVAAVQGVVEPSLCVLAQGSKEFLLGASRYRYEPEQYLLATVDLPHVRQIVEASPERPTLSLRVNLTTDLVEAVLIEVGVLSTYAM